MIKPKVALIAVASRFESGGERSEKIMAQTKEQLETKEIEVVTGSKVIWDAADAIEVANQMAGLGPDLLIMIHATWVMDSIQYILVNNINCPVLLWAVPYVETFSLACVQHFGSILNRNDIACKYVYGLPEDRNLLLQIQQFATVAKAFKSLQKSRVALIGPRQTWRVAAAQDMTDEEWSFSKSIGTTFVHIEMDELIASAEAQSSKDADHVLNYMKQNNRLGKVEVDESRLRYAAQIYLAIKGLFQRYQLTAAAAECYPNYGCLTNLPASWLADEGIVLDTEGDLGHATIMSALGNFGKTSPVALAEVGILGSDDRSFYLVHEGSSAFSLAEDCSKVAVMPGGEKGTTVGFPLRALSEVTLANLSGRDGKYQLLIAKAATGRFSEDEWLSSGRKFLAKVNYSESVTKLFEQMFRAGSDHHFIIKEGDASKQLIDLGEMLRMKTVLVGR